MPRVNHDKLMGLIAKRTKDRRLLRLIRSYLNAGVMENGILYGHRRRDTARRPTLAVTIQRNAGRT